MKYAGAPKREKGEGSGGATAESIKRKNLQAKEREEKDKLAAYVFDPSFYHNVFGYFVLTIMQLSWI